MSGSASFQRAKNSKALDAHPRFLKAGTLEVLFCVRWCSCAEPTPCPRPKSAPALPTVSIAVTLLDRVRPFVLIESVDAKWRRATKGVISTKFGSG